MPPPNSIIIVGGSITGLMHGLSLTHPPSEPSTSSASPTSSASSPSSSPSITILERAANSILTSHGAGLVLRPELSTFLRTYLPSLSHLSLTPSAPDIEDPSALVVTSRARQYLDRSGAVIDSEPRAQPMISWDLLWNALRWEFDGGAEEGFVARFTGGKGSGIGSRRARGRYVHDAKVVGVEILGRDEKGGSGRRKVKITYVKTSEPDGEPRHVYADMVVAADGASSTVRELLFDRENADPSPGNTNLADDGRVQDQDQKGHITNSSSHPSAPSHRRYAGYIAWRGSLPESLLSPPASHTLLPNITFHHTKSPGTQFIAYLIPGPGGSVAPSTRTLSWCWYLNYPHSSHPETISLAQALTSRTGHKHSWTIPSSELSSETWKYLKNAARELPPQLEEVVRKSEGAFGQVVTDSSVEVPDVGEGMVRVVGDALAGVRPHAAAGAALGGVCAAALGREMGEVREIWEVRQGRNRRNKRDERDDREAVEGSQVEGVGEGDTDADAFEARALQRWRDEVMQYARKMSALGIELGERSRKGEHPFAV